MRPPLQRCYLRSRASLNLVSASLRPCSTYFQQPPAHHTSNGKRCIAAPYLGRHTACQQAQTSKGPGQPKACLAGAVRAAEEHSAAQARRALQRAANCRHLRSQLPAPHICPIYVSAPDSGNCNTSATRAGLIPRRTGSMSVVQAQTSTYVKCHYGNATIRTNGIRQGPSRILEVEMAAQTESKLCLHSQGCPESV